MINTKVRKAEKVTYSIVIEGFESEEEAASVRSALLYKVMCGSTVLALCTGEVPQAIKKHWDATRCARPIIIERL